MQIPTMRIPVTPRVAAAAGGVAGADVVMVLVGIAPGTDDDGGIEDEPGAKVVDGGPVLAACQVNCQQERPPSRVPSVQWRRP